VANGLSQNPSPALPKIPFPPQNLQAGDILLSCGRDPISRFICEMDNGKYSHAAVWDGSCVVEAADSGIRKVSIEHEMKIQRYVDVYRWHTDSTPPIMLGAPGYPPDPVITRADQMAASGAGYSYSELLMGALIIWVSKRPKSIRLRLALRLLGDEIDRWIQGLIADPEKQGVTCTEVICRSFQEAKRPPNYGIYVYIDGSRHFRPIPAAWLTANQSGVVAANAFQAGNPALLLPEFQTAAPTLWTPVMPVSSTQSSTPPDATAEKFGNLFLQAVGGLNGAQLKTLGVINAQDVRFASGTPGQPVRALAGTDVPLVFITPRELQCSPNLKYMGRLPGTLKRFLPGSLWLDMFAMIWDALMRWLAPYVPVPLRLAVGGIFLWHGISNLLSGLPGVAERLQGLGVPVASVSAVILVWVEMVGGACIALGLFTSGWAATLAIVTMIALWKVPGAFHSGFRWMLLAGTLSLVALGDGALSLMGVKKHVARRPPPACP